MCIQISTVASRQNKVYDPVQTGKGGMLSNGSNDQSCRLQPRGMLGVGTVHSQDFVSGEFGPHPLLAYVAV